MKISSLLKNILGPVTNKKIIALFVDDFGSIRVKNKAVCKRLLKRGIPDHIYLRDTLASEQDLIAIFETLSSIKDANNHPACFTPFVIMANPDFEKIKNDNFRKYYRESFVKTLQRYGQGYEHAFDLWKEGMAERLFVPAFHGTEHLNVKKWLKALSRGHKSTMLAFENESICIPAFIGEERIDGLVKACDIEKCSDIQYIIEDIKEGTELFRTILETDPILFTPGAATYCPLIERDLYRCGIRYVDVPRCVVQPLGDGKFVRPFHYLGQKNNIGQHYIVRNCAFEPVTGGDAAIASCFEQIAAAFMMHKPAIISSHRLNYIGHFDENNRTENLKRLRTLLEMVKKHWPEVIFVNGRELCSMYK